MDEQKLLKAGINYEAGVRRFGGKREMYEKFLSKFPEDESYGNMMKALDAGDWSQAFFHAHTLKGVSGNLSMDELYSCLVPFVEAFRSNDAERVRALEESVRASYEAVVQAVRQCRD